MPGSGSGILRCVTGVELDGDGGVAGEGAGEGGAEIAITIVIITIRIRAPVALGGGPIIDLHPASKS